MNIVEIKNNVVNVLSEMFENMYVASDVLELVDLIDDLGMDSLTFITAVVKLEALFNITFPDEMLLMENFKTVDNIVTIINNEVMRTVANNE